MGLLVSWPSFFKTPGGVLGFIWGGMFVSSSFLVVVVVVVVVVLIKWRAKY